MDNDTLSKSGKRRRNKRLRLLAGEIEGATIVETSHGLKFVCEGYDDDGNFSRGDTIKTKHANISTPTTKVPPVAEIADLDEAVQAILDASLKARHRPVFEWLCGALNVPPEKLVSDILRNAIMREAPAYREAQGHGGGTSKTPPVGSEG